MVRIVIALSGWALLVLYLFYEYIEHGAEFFSHFYNLKDDPAQFIFHVMVFLAPVITTYAAYLIHQKNRALTQRAEMEDKMQEALLTLEGEKLKSDSIIAGISDAISIQDTNYKILYQNQVHKDIIGDHVGDYCYQAYEHEKSICEGCPLTKCFQDGNIHQAERSTIIGKDEIHVEVTASPLKSSSGEIMGGIEVVRDITDRKLANEALRQSKEFNQSTLNSLLDHIAVLDSHGTILTVNDAWTRFAIENDINFPESVGPGVNYLRICRKASNIGDETVAKALDGIQSVIDGSSEYFDMEYPCDSPTAKRWFLMRAIPFRGRRGKVIVAHINITSRKMAEEEMMKSEKRSRKLMEHSPIAIAILTPDGKLSQVNAAWKKLWGFSDEETAQVMASYNFLTDKQVENLGHAPLVERAFKGEHIILPPINYEGNRTIEDIELEDIEAQSRMIQVHIYAVKDAKGEVDYVVAINMDLTELQRAEQEARAQRETLARIDRASSMGQLTGSIAHELNQPLTGILSNAQAAEMLLEKGQYDHDELTEIMAEIGNDVKRAGAVIQNLRELYCKQMGEFLPVDINANIDETIKLLHSELVLQNVVLTTELTSSIPMIDGNRIQIQQVLVNLIMNGIQAMSDMVRNDRLLHILTSFDANEVKAWVEDCGPGIDADKIDSIFEPLSTWKPGGTGMGLAISNSIIEAHGGKMMAENRPEGGARVGFAIPVLKGGKQS